MRIPVAALLLCTAAADWPRYDTTAQLPKDARARLDRNLVVTGAGCERTQLRLDQLREPREAAIAGGELARLLKVEDCGVVCLLRGAPIALVAATADLRRYDGDTIDAALEAGDHSRAHTAEKELDEWYDRDCSAVELGFITYGNAANVYWVHPQTGQRHIQRRLVPGDEGTVWLTAGLGHRFVVVDEAGETLGEYEATHDAIHSIVAAPRPVSKRSAEQWKRAEDDLRRFEQNRANRVRRTWTKRGYDRAPLPPALFADIATYWYNNAATCLVYEEWGADSAHVNWWSAPPEMCYLPFGLKRRWHDALRPLVEQWIGNVELEDTDLYGLRRYTRGSTLMPHVDREETHAASVIVNIGQYGMDEAWPLQIYDLHSGEMTNVTMEPGELLFYESAKCLHGREVPLQGDAFVSLFAHYRPRDAPRWFLEDKTEALEWDYSGLPYSLGDAEEQVGSKTRTFVVEDASSPASGEL